MHGDEGPGGQQTQSGQAPGDGEMVFRAITARGVRRGIRLERIFWNALADAARARNLSMAELVGDIAATVPSDGNLASAIRVEIARFMRDRMTALEARSAPELTIALLQACPSPVFALSPDRKIVSYNRPFAAFIQSRFEAVEPAELLRGLRLTLDTPLEQIIDNLSKDPQAQVTTGYALGVLDRRVRGQMRMALAPTAARLLVLAYLVGSN